MKTLALYETRINSNPTIHGIQKSIGLIFLFYKADCHTEFSNTPSLQYSITPVPLPYQLSMLSNHTDRTHISLDQ